MNEYLKSPDEWFLPPSAIDQGIKMWNRTTDGRNLMVGFDAASTDGDHTGVALYSVAHPSGDVTVHDIYTVPPLRLNPESLERLEINIQVPPGPEIAYAYSGPATNDEFGPAAVLRLAWERQYARARKKMRCRARYMRRQRRIAYRLMSQ